MGRFDKKARKRIEDEEVSMSVYEDEDEEKVSKKTPGKASKKQLNTYNKNYNDDADEYEDDDEDDEDDSPQPKKFIIIGVGIALLVFIALFFFIFKKPKEVPEPTPNTTKETTTYLSDEERMQREIDELGFGINSQSGDGTYIEVTSLAKLKDFMGNEIAEDYTVVNTTTTTDVVVGKKYRTVTDDGIELYYFIGMYKGKQCIITLPYSIFSTINEEDSIICEIEIVKTSTDNYIVTYFRPIKDPKITVKGK